MESNINSSSIRYFIAEVQLLEAIYLQICADLEENVSIPERCF